MRDAFIHLRLSFETIDNFLLRSCIRDFLLRETKNMTGTFLDFGCGDMPYREFLTGHAAIQEYIALDLDIPTAPRAKRPDLAWDGEKIPLQENYCDCAMATEVFEHCPQPELVMKELVRVLKPGGRLFFTVPFLWPFHEVPRDEYRYTPFSLERHLRNSGFSTVTIQPFGGWHAAFAQALGLWIKRSPMSLLKRRFFYLFFKPFYSVLLRKDVAPVEFSESTMVIGLCGTALK
jgi:SAM-dependent methyltransferase